MPTHHCGPVASWCLLVLIVAALLLAETTMLRAEPAPGTAAGSGDLYLDVAVNGTRINLVAAFHHSAAAGLAIAPDELAELGIGSEPSDVGPDGLIALDRLAGVTYGYDPKMQAISLTVPHERLLPRRYELTGPRRAPTDMNGAAAPMTGAVANYTLFATAGTDLRRTWPHHGNGHSLSAAVDLHAFGRFGVVSQSAIAGSGGGGSGRVVRLDTTWTASDPHAMVTRSAGDIISGGLAWTRPVRLGGLQVRRNFDLRPDLVTIPTPTLSGSAAVPSTVDVYAENVRLFSKDVPAGRFEIHNVPAVTGARTAHVVVTDGLGRESAVEVPFYASPRQLRQGLFDYALEAGFPRASYGVRSADYDLSPAVSASLRYGVADWLTLEGHGEAMPDMVNLGSGVVLPLPYGLGVVSAATAVSQAARTGGLLAGSVEIGWNDIALSARTQRTVGDYHDIASHSANRRQRSGAPFRAGAQAARAVDQATASFPFVFDRSRVNLSFTRLVSEGGRKSAILGGSYSQPFLGRAVLHASAFTAVDGDGGTVISAGLSMPLGGGVTANSRANSGSGTASAGASIAKSAPARIGATGWRLHARTGRHEEVGASASHRTRFARLRGSIRESAGRIEANAEVEGALAIADGDLYLANRIDDAFAVIDAGEPGVEVRVDNRPIGRTGRNGRMLATGLNAWQANRIAIDPRDLPIDAEITSTRQIVVPPERGGVMVDFGVSTQAASAVVVLHDRVGDPIAAGSRARLGTAGPEVAVGYDGEAFVRGLSARNTITVTLPDGSRCLADFGMPDNRTPPIRIEGVTCR